MAERNRLFLKWLALTLVGVLVMLSIPIFGSMFEKRNSGDVIIVLDPGHGGEDVGAVNHDIPLREADLNLAIAFACRDELLRYEGVEVYMTHEGLADDVRMTLDERAAFANSVDADILISLHCNDAESKTANGTEVYVSHSTYSKHYRRESTQLAVCILMQFRELGFTVRGVKTRLSNGDRVYVHDDGSSEIGDYYGVIGDTIGLYNIPGILVEHGFMYGDSSRLDTPEKLAAAGKADAAGIAKFFGLKLKGEPHAETQEVFVTSEQELLSASDAAAKIIAIPDNVTANSYTKVEKARLAYSCLTEKGRELIGSEHAQKLIDAVYRCDDLRHSVVLSAAPNAQIRIERFFRAVYIEKNGSMTVRELRKALAVQKKDSSNIDLSEVDKEIIVLDKNGDELKDGAVVSTGCIVVLTLDERAFDELRIVILGDISGDGKVDTLDRYLLEDYLSGSIGFGELRRLAADRNGDGFVTEADLEFFE